MSTQDRAGRKAKPAAKPIGDVNVALRQRQALQLLIAGATYEQIAETCGWQSRASAYKACRRALQMWMTPVIEEARALEAARLDSLLRVQMRKALDPHNKSADWACDRVLRISESRRKLLGLDAPPLALAAEQQPRLYIVGVPDDLPPDAPLPPLALPDGVPQPGPSDVVRVVSQSVLDAV